MFFLINKDINIEDVSLMSQYYIYNTT